MSVLDDLEEMTGALGGAGTALDGITEAMGRLNNGALQTQAALARSGQAASDARGRFVAAGEGTNRFGSALDMLKDKASSIVDGLVPTSGALGAVVQALKALGPEGEAVAVILGIVVTVVTALASELWSLTRAAIAISQEKDALSETFAALSDGAKSGLELVDSLSDVAASLPQAEGKVLGWGKALMAAGKQGEALEQSVRAVAAANAIMGESGSAAATTLIKRFEMMAAAGQQVKLDRRILSQLAEAGISAKALGEALGVPADKLGSMSLDASKLGDAMEKALIQKGAGALEKMSLSWSSISGKLHDAWEDLFEDLGKYVQPLMGEIRDFFAEFSAGTKLQGAAKSAVTSFFSTVFSWATKAMHAIHVGFLALEIGALRVYIALAPVIRALRLVLTNSNAILGMKVIFGLLIAQIVLVGAILLGLAAAIGAAFGVIGTAIGFVVGAVSTAVGYIGNLILRAEKYLAGLGTSAKTAASNFIAGLVGGISSGVGAVVEAVRGVASSAVSAFTSALGIKSPSRVMKAHGRQLPAGTAEGIDDGADEAQRSMEDMLEPPKAKSRARGRDASGPARIVNVYYTGPAKDFPSFREQALGFFQEELGAGPEMAPA